MWRIKQLKYKPSLVPKLLLLKINLFQQRFTIFVPEFHLSDTKNKGDVAQISDLYEKIVRNRNPKGVFRGFWARVLRRSRASGVLEFRGVWEMSFEIISGCF